MQARLWVPSPLVGEGRDEGETVSRPHLPLDTLSLTLSHQRRGEDTGEHGPPPKFVPNTIRGRLGWGVVTIMVPPYAIQNAEWGSANFIRVAAELTNSSALLNAHIDSILGEVATYRHRTLGPL
jgi:hypothetical protein